MNITFHSNWKQKLKDMNPSIMNCVWLIHFGILFSSIECIHLGMISPIEVVEEFGCHDTELRLTCGNLDSKLAVLEATFSPNCTHDECLRFDMKRLVRTFASEETEDSKNAEKEAGKKFLETLRQSHSNEEDIEVDTLDDGGSVDKTTNRAAYGQKKKRTSLRLVLERLIIQYLRQISPEDELDAERFARFRRNALAEPIHSGRINVTSAFFQTSESLEDLNTSEEEDSNRTQSTRPHCEEQRRQISSLNRLDLEKSYTNQSDNEYNIRRVLNKRCSGKNHCSFIFSIDHPFAKVWEGGVVRVKYICMEDFRINRYCGEHLTIGYEIDPNIHILDTGKGEPVAESRIQPRETALHSLKIIKADKNIAPDSNRNLNSTFQEPRKIKTVLTAKHQEDTSTEVYKNRVYSQDFRVLKILPSNLDDFNDIETIGDEIYFRKEEITTEESILNEPSISTSDNELLTTSASEINEFVKDTSFKEEAEHNKNGNSSILENVTLTIREGGHYIMVYSSLNDTHNDNSGNRFINEMKREGEANNVSQEFPTSIVPLKKLFEFNSSSSTQTPKLNIKDYMLTERNYPILQNNKQKDNVLDEDVIKSDESRMTYNSIQRTSYRSPLLHGFAMTPGYPKFYIGDFDCYWNILAPEGIRVRISIIDISLRFDDVCKDFLQIDDYGINRTLFNSCADAIQPIGIISTSNWIKITVKTTSKFAYPKRGVLLHYTADGCVNPPLPANVKLVDRTATTAFYECQPSFLFPDSGLSTRKLTCNKIHLWDNLLPDCVEQENLSRTAVPSEEKLTVISKKPDLSLTNIMPSHNETDMIFDIVIPSVLIAGLFIINGAIFAIIMKYRKRSKALEDREMELAEL